MAEVDLTEYNGGALVGTVIVLLILSWISVGLRTYTRAVLMKCLEIDDWLMIVAQITFTASCACIIQGVRRGLGRHNDAIVNEDDKIAALMWQAIATITYIIDMMFIKLSIGLFLLRVSVKRVYNYIIWSSLVVVALWSLGIFLWDIFQCWPVENQWDYRITNGKCASASDIIAAAYAISVMTIVSDWLYALLPIPMLWSVKMTKQAKATVIAILGLGVFASIATLVRLGFLDKIQDSADLLYSATDVMVWTLIEPGVAIVASSLATIRPLLRAMRIRGFESTDHTHSTGVSARARYPGGGRAPPRAMPAFGPCGVSLQDIEPGHEPRKQLDVPLYSMGLDFEENPRHTGSRLQYSPTQPNNNDATKRPPSAAKSEVYVIEGVKHSPAWSTNDDFHDNNRSFEQIHDLEEQSQESGNIGLGLSSDRGK